LGKFKPEYGFLLNQKYFQYTNYENIKIQSTLSNLLMYNLEINFSKKLLLQIGLKQKNANLPISSNINDLLTLINFEWGQTLTAFQPSENSLDFHLEQLTQSQEINLVG
jgi:hypothetical protein